jgi:hypothetical protein
MVIRAKMITAFASCLLSVVQGEAQTTRPKIPIYVECSCSDRLGKIFGDKLHSLLAASTPYRISSKSEAVFRYTIVSVDGEKTRLAPVGHLSAISVLITGDHDEWVHHAVYAVTDDTVDEAAQSDLRNLSDLIMEAMRQRNK